MCHLFQTQCWKTKSDSEEHAMGQSFKYLQLKLSCKILIRYSWQLYCKIACPLVSITNSHFNYCSWSKQKWYCKLDMCAHSHCHVHVWCFLSECFSPLHPAVCPTEDISVTAKCLRSSAQGAKGLWHNRRWGQGCMLSLDSCLWVLCIISVLLGAFHVPVGTVSMRISQQHLVPDCLCHWKPRPHCIKPFWFTVD